MGITIDQFGKAVVASGLLTADELKGLWSTLGAEERPKDGERFAKLLVDRKKLTPFQAFEILAGRGSRLIMGEYSIVSQIGAGGMGQVYKAQHRRMKRIVALKVMSGAAMKDAAAVKRFQREVEAAARLEHPNIVTAYDSGDAGNVKYLVMQFVDGGDLSELVKKKGPPAVDKAIGYILQTARGLSYAHSRGVIHRDIKPANLLLHKDGTVKVLDMGLARMEDAGGELTATEQVMGTVDYMSPEQASDTKNVDGRADIYALGCTLWFLLTGKKIYDGDTMIIRLMKHRDAPLPSLVKERDDVPWPLEQAFHRMIAKRPQDRYQSMDEVIAALSPFAESADSVLSHGGGSGGSSVLRNSEMASFMQAMESGIGMASQPIVQTKPASGSRLDLTSHVGAPEAETDPNRSSLSKGSGSKVRAAGSSSTVQTGAVPGQPAVRPAKGSSKKWIGVGVGVVAAIGMIAAIIVGMQSGPEAASANPETAIASNSKVASLPAIPAATKVGAVPVKPAMGNDAVLLDSLDYTWTPSENLGPTVNTRRAEEFPSLSADELCLVFWAHGPGGPSTFMECRRNSITESFGEAVRIPGQSGEDPFLTADGLTLIYGMNAGDRRFDLRMRSRATRESAWGVPQSFDSQINTDQDERQPWLSPDLCTLTFSSARPGSLGGRDIWISRRRSVSESFGEPENAGKGVNSTRDEGDSRVLSDGRNMLFSRDGKQYLTFTNSQGIPSAFQLHDFPNDGREPWLSPDGKRMYFQSRRPGNFGDYDLYVMRRVKKLDLETEKGIPTFSAAAVVPTATGVQPASSLPANPAEMSPYELLTSPDFEWSPPTSLGPTINSTDEDRHPYLSADGLTLLFDSNRPGGQGDFDIWESHRTSPDAPWQSPVNLGPNINRDKRDESPSLCDGDLTLFYSGTGHDGAIASAQSIVYASRKDKNSRWDAAEALGQAINGSGSNMNPKVSFDGMTLVYGSSGGFSMGAVDLWFSKRTTLNERFVTSYNFKAPISSSGDERDACLSSDGRVLIFASTRGSGPENLWMAVRFSVSDSWSEPVEFAAPLNTPQQEMGPALSFDGRTLYFNSNRDGGKSDLFVSHLVPKKVPSGK